MAGRSLSAFPWPLHSRSPSYSGHLTHRSWPEIPTQAACPSGHTQKRQGSRWEAPLVSEPQQGLRGRLKICRFYSLKEEIKAGSDQVNFLWLRYEEGTSGSKKGLKPQESSVSCSHLVSQQKFPQYSANIFPMSTKTHLPKKITTCQKDTASCLQCPVFPSSLVTGPGCWPLPGMGLSTPWG